MRCSVGISKEQRESVLNSFFESTNGENRISQIVWQCIPDTRPGDWKTASSTG